jgi:hypothetical protein
VNAILAAHWVAESRQAARGFDRTPCGFCHNLSTLGLFSMGVLERLSLQYATRTSGYFVAAAAFPAAGNFSPVPHGQYGPRQALEWLERLTSASRSGKCEVN